MPQMEYGKRTLLGAFSAGTGERTMLATSIWWLANSVIRPPEYSL